MQNYQVVPKMLTGKDLDYLSDMFEWNVGALKKVNEAIGKVKSEDIKAVLQKGFTLFSNNLDMVIEILNEGDNNE